MEREAYGCGVVNRFVDLEPDCNDTLDLTKEMQKAQEKRKKKREEVDKKTKKRAGQRDTVRDARTPLAPPERDSLAVGKQQEPQDQGRAEPESEEVRGRSRKKTAVERRASQDAILQELLNPKLCAHGSSDSRPRGAIKTKGGKGSTKNSDNFKSRGKREYDRHSGSKISPAEKREGRGPWNWGCIETSGDFMEAILDLSTKSEDIQAYEEDEEKRNGVQGADGELEISAEMTLDEWRAKQELSRPRAEFNIRKAEDTIPTKAKVIHQSRQQEKLGGIMECMEDGNSLRKRVKNLPFCLEISFGSRGRTTRKGKGSQIDPTSHPEKAKPVLEKNEMVLNTNDLEEFPRL